MSRGERLQDKTLVQAVKEASDGLIAADLGGGVIKQRVARPGQGKRGGFRVLIAFRAKQRSVFLFGFAKNELDNIDNKQLATLQDLAAGWLKATEAQISRAMTDRRLEEVRNEQPSQKD